MSNGRIFLGIQKTVKEFEVEWIMCYLLLQGLSPVSYQEYLNCW